MSAEGGGVRVSGRSEKAGTGIIVGVVVVGGALFIYAMKQGWDLLKPSANNISKAGESITGGIRDLSAGVANTYSGVGGLLNPAQRDYAANDLNLRNPPKAGQPTPRLSGAYRWLDGWGSPTLEVNARLVKQDGTIIPSGSIRGFAKTSGTFQGAQDQPYSGGRLVNFKLSGGVGGKGPAEGLVLQGISPGYNASEPMDVEFHDGHTYNEWVAFGPAGHY